MNERIKQLFMVATTQALKEEPTDYIARDLIRVEKFAELIINECIDVIKPTQEHEAWAGSYLGGEDGLELLHLKINDVKRNFGIM